MLDDTVVDIRLESKPRVSFMVVELHSNGSKGVQDSKRAVQRRTNEILPKVDRAAKKRNNPVSAVGTAS